jgi:small subunit ribosomal protein S6
MNKYEMIYILDTACTDEKREALMAKIENVVVKAGGTVEKVEKWGVKKLAYPINKKPEGYYVVMQFEAEPTLPKELDRRLRISDFVMRHLIVNKDEDN